MIPIKLSCDVPSGTTQSYLCPFGMYQDWYTYIYIYIMYNTCIKVSYILYLPNIAQYLLSATLLSCMLDWKYKGLIYDHYLSVKKILGS
jgi:hypothetical protein